MNIHGSALVPNNWELQGKEDDAEQADWYLAMFSACEKRDWVKGFGIWDWPGSMARKSLLRESMLQQIRLRDLLKILLQKKAMRHS